jgi:hypothetical protein
MREEIFRSVHDWLVSLAEDPIQENIVDTMLSSMEEPLMSSLPTDGMFSMIPPQMKEQVKIQIVASVKAQTLVCLRSLINANKENSDINRLIIAKHFSQEAQEEGLIHVEKYSEAYAQEVESFYQKIQASDLDRVIHFN